MTGVDIGDPPLIGYNVYYKEALPDSSPWIRLDRGNALDLSQMIDGLSPDMDYLFGVSAVKDGVGGEGPLKNVTASTSCLREYKLIHIACDIRQCPPPPPILHDDAR